MTTNTTKKGLKVKETISLISKNELIDIIRKRNVEKKGHTYVQIFATTDVKMNKGGRENSNHLYGNVVKDGNINASFDFEYEKSVNSALKKQGENDDFVAKERQWGRHMVINHVFNVEMLEFEKVYSRVIIEHEKDGEKRYYLQLKVNPDKCKKPVYRYKDTGEILSEKDKEIMYSYMPKREKEIIVLRDYRIDNVKRIHIDGEKYSII